MLRRTLFFAALMLAAGTANAEDLTVYTALEADQIKAYEASFAKANPDIKIRWIRDSAGVVTAKLVFAGIWKPPASWPPSISPPPRSSPRSLSNRSRPAEEHLTVRADAVGRAPAA
jgi:hypothetical protein